MLVRSRKTDVVSLMRRPSAKEDVVKRAIAAILIVAVVHLALLSVTYLECFGYSVLGFALPASVHNLTCLTAMVLGYLVLPLYAALEPLYGALFNALPEFLHLAVLDSLLWGIAVYAVFRLVWARRRQKR
jgi:hypothetical protein